MPGFDLLVTNLLSPIVLAFVLGIVAGAMRSELELPEPVLKLFSIYLLFSIGLTGGRELARVTFTEVAPLMAHGSRRLADARHSRRHLSRVAADGGF